MESLMSRISVRVNEHVYLKDPASSDLGNKIIDGSITLIDELGFESFTFKKLAKAIGSTEASIYRYFESKHKLLLYISALYWQHMEYRVAFHTANVESASERLKRAIKLLTQPVETSRDNVDLDEVKLNRIVISESSKAYLTKEVDIENKDGVFRSYKSLVGRISDIILEINSDYKYPHMLVSTVIEGAHHQHFFAEHLPRLTDVIEGEDAVTNFYTEIVFKAIRI